MPGATLQAMTDTDTVAAFVARARRVEAHSLLSDRDRFLAWARGAMRIEVTQDSADATRQSARVYFDLPAEEVFESLASRVRPMLLSKEPIYFDKVLKILDPLVPQDQASRHALASIRDHWENASQRKTEIGYSLNDTADAALAFAWLYGDLVHADDIREWSAEFPIDHRYRAAVLVFSTAAVAAIETLNLIRQLRTVGTIELPDTAFTEPVTANPDASYPVTGIAQVPVGTSSEDLGRLLDDASRNAQST